MEAKGSSVMCMFHGIFHFFHYPSRILKKQLKDGRFFKDFTIKNLLTF